MGFIVAHFLLVWCIAGFIMPGWLDVFIVPERRDDWRQPMAPCLLRDTTDGEIADRAEAGLPGAAAGEDSVEEEKHAARTKDSRRGGEDGGLANGNLRRGGSSSSSSSSGGSRTLDPRSDDITGKQM